MASTRPTDAPPIRHDPAYDRRRLLAFGLGLVAFYVGAVLVLSPSSGDLVRIALPLMFAPTVGALTAFLFAHGRVQFGRPTKHLLLAFVPPAVILLVTWAAAGFTEVEIQSGNLVMLILLSAVFALSGATSAIGEEIGWRGFLWPLLRRHAGFWAAAAVMIPVWWLYHLPAILWWGYGSVGGLPAFTVMIAGFALFAGVLTERSNGIWASVLAHGAWNGMVAKAYSSSLSAEAPTCDASGCGPFAGDSQLFTGPQTLLGEFGWIAAVTMLAIGLVAATWHLRHPVERDAPTHGRAEDRLPGTTER